MSSLPKIMKSRDVVLGQSKVRLYQELIQEEEQEQEQGRVAYDMDEEVERIYVRAKQRSEQTAARILEEAYAERDRIVRTAEEDRVRTRERAREQGYEEGLYQAAQKISGDIENISAEVRNLKASMEDAREELAGKMVALSLDMAEKILHKKLEEDDMAMEQLALDVIRSEKEKKKMVLTVSDRTGGLIEALEEELEPVRERYQSTIKIKSADGQEGICRLDIPEGIIEASVFSQLDNLREELKLLEQDGAGI